MKLDRVKIEIEMANNLVSYSETAEKAGISKQRFSTILKQKNISPKTAGKIAKALGVDVTEIIET